MALELSPKDLDEAVDGTVLVAWFGLDGPTVGAIGWTEVDGERYVFYRHSSPCSDDVLTLGTLAGVGADQPADFGHLLVHALILANNTAAALGGPPQPLRRLPLLVLTNGNRRVAGALLALWESSCNFKAAELEAPLRPQGEVTSVCTRDLRRLDYRSLLHRWWGSVTAVVFRDAALDVWAREWRSRSLTQNGPGPSVSEIVRFLVTYGVRL